MKTKSGILLFLFVALMVSAGCKRSGSETPFKESFVADSLHRRLASAVIYEVNIRQITPEGTFRAFTEQHIDRLKKLGVDVLWLMPVYPISVKNRKGLLGSYYSVADYKGVNPEFGTLDDLKALINKAHEAGMLVIFDWVANHTGWDNKWIKEHPEWFTHDKKGKIVSPVPDWTDVADLNYDNPALNGAMIDALKYWVREAGIDGYRCDAAAMAPTKFWHEALASLDSIRPLIKLAEAWEPELMSNGFDAAYGWEFYHLLNDIAKGTKKVNAISSYIAKTDTLYAKDDMLMNFITNHDENSWAGTEYERMGSYVPGFAVLTYLMPGIPMIYNGQEAGFRKRLRFFDKDTVNFSDTLLYSFYRTLNNLKHDNPALRAGINAGALQFKPDTLTNMVMISRSSGTNQVLGVLNFSGKAISGDYAVGVPKGSYKEAFSHKEYKVRKTVSINLKPWEFIILVKK